MKRLIPLALASFAGLSMLSLAAADVRAQPQLGVECDVLDKGICDTVFIPEVCWPNGYCDPEQTSDLPGRRLD